MTPPLTTNAAFENLPSESSPFDGSGCCSACGAPLTGNALGGTQNAFLPWGLPLPDSRVPVGEVSSQRLTTILTEYSKRRDRQKVIEAAVRKHFRVSPRGKGYLRRGLVTRVVAQELGIRVIANSLHREVRAVVERMGAPGVTYEHRALFRGLEVKPESAKLVHAVLLGMAEDYSDFRDLESRKNVIAGKDSQLSSRGNALGARARDPRCTAEDYSGAYFEACSTFLWEHAFEGPHGDRDRAIWEAWADGKTQREIARSLKKSLRDVNASIAATEALMLARPENRLLHSWGAKSDNTQPPEELQP